MPNIQYRDFLNNSDYLSYPFVHGPRPTILPSCTVPMPRKGIADAGFMLGESAEFDILSDGVYLRSFEITASDIRFDFRSNAIGFSDYRWLFSFSHDSDIGASQQVDATHIVSGVSDYQKGWAFLSVGNLTDLLAFGVGVHELCSFYWIEPALIQSLESIGITSINLANDRRSCPPKCKTPCEDTSSSSSSSYNPTEPITSINGVKIAHPTYLALSGNIRFIEGYNSEITVNALDNEIVIGAVVGAGMGEPCHDILVDEKGLRVDYQECETCSDFIRSINGKTSENGVFQLSNGPGVTVTAQKHSVSIKFLNDQVCE